MTRASSVVDSEDTSLPKMSNTDDSDTTFAEWLDFWPHKKNRRTNQHPQQPAPAPRKRRRKKKKKKKK